MKAPISWLKEYVDIKLPLSELMWKMTEVGLTTENATELNGEVVLDAEITPNRPDWMSIIGIAREIAAIQNSSLKMPKLIPLSANNKGLKFAIKNDFTLCPRFSGVTIKGVTQNPSPKWMQDRLIAVELRPINNLVDITNYVMLETGNPIHVFDYDKLHKGEMTIMKSNQGDKFISVDDKKHILPKNSIIFKSNGEIVDLCGIKGGLNSGVSKDTTNILILAAVYNGQLIRRTSQYLNLWSEASRIFERGANAGGTLDALIRTTNLVQENAGGELASEIIDEKSSDFKPWNVSVNLEKLELVLGIRIENNLVYTILERLNLSPKLINNNITCSIPTYRGDIRIEEDLIEEVARLYGYNNFPKTLPIGEVPVKKIPYFKDYNLDQKIKNILIAAGFSEIQTYSLISEKDLAEVNISSQEVLRIDNPVSREYEYMRPDLKSSLIKALKGNKPYFENINIFECGKVYLGNSIRNSKEEYQIAGLTNNKSFSQVKGIIERIFYEFQIDKNPVDYIEKINDAIYFSFPYTLLKGNKTFRKFKPLPKYPPILEDMAFIIKENTSLGKIMYIIKKQSTLIADVRLYDKYQEIRTFRITYQDINKNLTTEDVAPIREKILKELKKINVQLKL